MKSRETEKEKTRKNFKILPEMMLRFNQNMYNHKRDKAVGPRQDAAQTLSGCCPDQGGGAKVKSLAKN